MKYAVALTDIVNGKEKIIKKTRSEDDVEAWLSNPEEYPDHDWRYLDDKIKKKENDL